MSRQANTQQLSAVIPSASKIPLWKKVEIGRVTPSTQNGVNKMHAQKPLAALKSGSPGKLIFTRRRFDTLDWVAALFVVATPLYIVYRLFYS